MELTSITLEPSSTEIGIGGISVIWATCNISPCPTLTWSISDPTIASIESYPSTSSCMVTGSSNGSTDITVYADGISTKITITVTGSSLQSIEIDPKTVNIDVGRTSFFKAACRDQNNNFIACPTLKWDSSDPLVGTIDQTGILTGYSEGTTKITASAIGKTSNIALATVPPVKFGDFVIFGGIIMGAVYIILKRPQISEQKFKTT
jgi:uncharacterized protein YjdB